MADIDLSLLTDDAKAVAAAFFSMMVPGIGKLTLHLVDNVPHPRTKAGLDELVDKGICTVEPFNSRGGLVYTPIVNCRPALAWALENDQRPELKFSLMIPAQEAADG